MKFLFIVQGEGRGHMTQAIALSDMLRSSGHEVCRVLVGKSARREIPEFFYKKINAPVETYESPNFVTDAGNKKIRLWSTISYNILSARKYFKNLAHINKIVKEEKPDVIINFYELLCGLFFLFYNPRVRHIAIGHQFLLLHPAFRFPNGWWMDKKMLRFNTFITSLRAEKYLALSFRNMQNVPQKKLYVVPPLLRRELFDIQTKNEGFILGYLLNSGYADEIINWHATCPQQKARFFWDKKDAPEDLQINDNLSFHRLDDQKFLQYMGNCKGYASTAGFESLCEAIYLGKPILMVPTGNHFEQACNALDAEITGAGIQSDWFNLNALIDYMPKHRDISPVFRDWANKSAKMILHQLEN